MRAKGWLVVAAQVNRATTSGTVTDQSGAAIPGVTVTVTGESGIVQTASTNEAGQYSLRRPGIKTAAGHVSTSTLMSSPGRGRDSR